MDATGTPVRVLPSAVPTLHSIVPFFIVDIVENLQSRLDFYHSKLGFEIAHKGGATGKATISGQWSGATASW
jgi:hypothetical protein